MKVVVDRVSNVIWNKFGFALLRSMIGLKICVTVSTNHMHSQLRVGHAYFPALGDGCVHDFRVLTGFVIAALFSQPIRDKTKTNCTLAYARFPALFTGGVFLLRVLIGSLYLCLL